MLDNWELLSLGGTKVCRDKLLGGTGLVKQGFSTRIGGKGTGQFSTLNLAMHVGDDQNTVYHNRKLFSHSLNVNHEHWVALNQIHSDKIFVIRAEDRGRGSDSPASVVGDGDAMITNEQGIPLVTFYADCISLFILDIANKAIGLVHAGWKGTNGEIGKKTIAAMRQEFATNPANCLVAIGPGIDKCCYEVDKPVYERLMENNFNWEKAIVSGDKQGKWLLDLKMANWLQFVDCGVKKENISVSSLCTKCHQELFFSYRGSGGRTGRMAALLMLNL